MRGGPRPNAGRKTGFSAIKAEKSREFIIRQVEASLKPIVARLIERAKQGDLKATQLLFDRAFGRPAIMSIEVSSENGGPRIIRIDE